MKNNLQAKSTYIPDTTLHWLNGSHVVDIGGMRTWLKNNVPWLSPEEADEFADSLRQAADNARQYRLTDDEEEEVTS